MGERKPNGIADVPRVNVVVFIWNGKGRPGMAEGIDGGAEVNPALVAGIKNRNGRIIQLPPPHSAGQRDIIMWPGSGVALCGRRSLFAEVGTVMV